VNLILFDPAEIDQPLPRGDRRARHILDVLRRQPGDTFDVGLINGPRGKATLGVATPDALVLTFAWGPEPPSLDAITLIVGLPRPQTARDILRDATTLGVRALHFVRTEKSEASYAQSTLWSSGEWRRHVIAGAEQAFATRIPEVTFGRGLGDIVAGLPTDAVRIALDNYESPIPLGEFSPAPDRPHVLALGAERGWSARERDELRAQRFVFAHLGRRVLRTETACVAALAILRAKLGWM
jgi:RsmE family RNA methyltransferase